MKVHFQQVVKAIILLAFSAMIASLHVTDNIQKFINPKYEYLSITASLLFFMLFIVQVTRILSFSAVKHHHCSHDHEIKLFSYIIILLPIISGFVFPAQLMDAAMAEKKGGVLMLAKQQQAKIEDYLTTNEPIVENIYDAEPDPGLLEGKQEMTKQEYDTLKKQLVAKPIIQMTDKDYTIYYEDINNNLSTYIGRKIQLKGFILKEEDFAENQLVLSRFFITHCIADASIVGFLAEFPEAISLQEDTWLEAIGTLAITELNGSYLPVIKIEEWVQIEEPQTPYLYPIDIFLSP
ncbi:TIGR03943 family putative permease subunit [Lysinibacillus piscis]|uniref:UPF0703 protein YcgQ n=1 Tax=Lysinibacillus piscis TaxID=2518931 RepID=A0ABQ5NLQ8_9BACI|nr:TIGR03943 family protein [Lysinibacillus sp. KH24]GLC89058.1 UPF0703 protein YcgQ [Lysinibacillus sp. KH24]